jgi:predicted naringenin-chalcone synthase
MSAAADTSAVLADFRPACLGAQVPQRALIEHQAWVMSVARGAREGVASTRGRNALLEEIKHQLARYAVSPKVIHQRQIAILPEVHRSNGEVSIPEVLGALHERLADQPEGPGLEPRMGEFARLVELFLSRHYPRDLTAPDDIVHVTCCGYLSPSPVQKMAATRGWTSTVVTHAYHMGCYAAFPAVRLASGFLASSTPGPGHKTRVDILHTEPVSVHFDVGSTTPGNLVTTTLFGDGFISYSAYSGREARARRLRGLRVIACHEQLVADSHDLMTWTPGPNRFDMRLSVRVPVLIGRGVLPFVRDLCARAGMDFDVSRDSMVYAVHPGGPRILSHVAEALGVDVKRMSVSADVLREHGNMSSATVPHIWDRIVADPQIEPGARVLSLAFGPGLTFAGMILEKV